MTERMQGKPEESKKTLEKLFTNAETQDARSVPVFDQARNLYREIMKELAKINIQKMWSVIEKIKKELSDISGYPVRIEAGNPPGETMAVIQMAWKHGRDYHLVIYKENAPDDILIHLVAHELEHLRFECAARKAGKNRFLVVSSKNKEKAISSMKEDVVRLKRKGFTEKSINCLTLQLAEGIVRQVQNGPIDLLIEKNLYNNYPLLRPAQFVSLAILAAQAEESVTKPNIRVQMPEHIVFASSAINGATALFLDKLWKGTTCYSEPYHNLDSFSASHELFSILEDRIETMNPGEEYEIVDVWAEKLGLKEWYQWQEDTGSSKEPEKTKHEAATDPELLKKKHPVAVWYFLDSLEKFDSMTEEEIRSVSFEIGMLGSTGLDYSSPDEKYTLRSLPGKKFSGLHLMCIMYAGFKRIAPEQDLGMDLEEPYRSAFQLHKHKKNKKKN